MFQRKIYQTVVNSLNTFPATVLLGPRQVGKTTLALQIGEKIPSIYLDLEKESDRVKLNNPDLYFQSTEGRLLILDEVQLFPNLFGTLRSIIDERKRKGLLTGQFLLLGSASGALLHQTSESLAGRVDYIEMSPLLINEAFLNWEELFLRGGFPDSLLAPTLEKSIAWRNAFIKTYLERDIPQWGPNIPASTLRRFWKMLAHNQAEQFNAAKLASSLGVSAPTVSRYLDLLVDLMLVRQLPAWSSNGLKRLIKSPKVYIRDSGLVHTLLDISDLEDLLSHPVLGSSYEGFVVETIRSQLPPEVSAYYYRSRSGVEVDLILEKCNQPFMAIEIKYSGKPTLSKGFYSTCDELNIYKRVVICPTDSMYPIDQYTQAMSLNEFLEIV